MSLYKHFPEPDFLMHHGVKGMKWGVRKNKQKSGNKKPKRMYILGLHGDFFPADEFSGSSQRKISEEEKRAIETIVKKKYKSIKKRNEKLYFKSIHYLENRLRDTSIDEVERLKRKQDLDDFKKDKSIFMYFMNNAATTDIKEELVESGKFKT